METAENTFEMLFWSPAAPFHEGDILTFAKRRYLVKEVLRERCFGDLFARLKLAGPVNLQ